MRVSPFYDFLLIRPKNVQKNKDLEHCLQRRKFAGRGVVQGGEKEKRRR